MTNKHEWPVIEDKTQNMKLVTIITCALLDEAANPGIFSQKLENALKLNSLPIVT